MTNDEQTPSTADGETPEGETAESETAESETAKGETAEGETAEGETAEGEERSRNWLYRIAASGVGAFVLAQEEIEGRLKRLIDRNPETLDDTDESAEARPVSEESEESEEAEAVPAKAERRPIGEYIDTTIANILHSVNMPSRGDLEQLTRQIDDLSEKVERLRAAG